MRIGIAMALLIICWYGILAASWMAISWQAAALAFIASTVAVLISALAKDE